MNNEQRLKLSEAMQIAELKRSAFLNRVKNGLLPKGDKFGGTTVLYPKSQIEAVNAARVLGYDDSKIRDLVVKLREKHMQEAERLIKSQGLEVLR